MMVIENDCAITQKTTGGPILLLETIPGMRFRSRIKRQDKVAALRYFRNLVEAHAQGQPTGSAVRHLLGLEGSYKPLYAHSLRIIPEDQLYDIIWDQPLGRGMNGSVYSAMWFKPAGYLATSGEQQQGVVLKEVASHRSVAALVKEIDITFASLGGRAVGCVEFLGVATVHQGSDKDDDLQPRKNFYLVFERATQGTIFDFLSRQFKDLTFIRTWYLLIDALTSIAGGISSLHKHRVLHRDLHMNNILVTDRFYPNDPEYPHEYAYLISDLGEGKILDAEHEIRNRFDARASYGALEFRAPEVNGSFGWSPKAETFSFGVIATKLIECRGYTCAASPPESVVSNCSNLHNTSSDTAGDNGSTVHLLPFALKTAIEPCFSHDPANRPALRDVVRVLEAAGSQFWADGKYSEDATGVTWTYWDWRESLMRGLSGEVNVAQPRSPDSPRGSYASGASDDFGDFEDLPVLDD
ncbi:kinase-like domain-containing protein [Aspergillus heterothallicus]